ncbi:hypothetical protein LCGC14_0541570 [marine sediment metagenome]|uniref:Uncharacterized protein n=1 Tax=marine sediment metagenome TaxID=412755 RepID=A0A0F9RSL3_9ZZZZ
MQKFQAEKPDLTLELTTLSGEEFTLNPESPVSGKIALEITERWSVLEKKQKKEELSGIEVIAEELSYIYPKEKEWFLENFDFGTLNTILTYVAQTIGGIKKKSSKSKES